MQIVTFRDRARNALPRFDRRYSDPMHKFNELIAAKYNATDESVAAIRATLAAIDPETATPEDYERAGWLGWISHVCHECGTCDATTHVLIGEDCTVYLCLTCVTDMFDLVSRL